RSRIFDELEAVSAHWIFQAQRAELSGCGGGHAHFLHSSGRQKSQKSHLYGRARTHARVKLAGCELVAVATACRSCRRPDNSRRLDRTGNNWEAMIRDVDGHSRRLVTEGRRPGPGARLPLERVLGSAWRTLT